MAHYKVNHADKKIEVSKEFNRLAANPNNQEFKILTQLISGFNGYSVEVCKTRKTANKGDKTNYAAIEKALQGKAAELKEYKKMKDSKVGFFKIKAWFKSLSI